MSRYATSCGRGPSAPAQPSRAYPELSALVGPKVPDLRGLFLRGYGSQAYTQNNGTTVGLTATLHTSGALGTVQGDAIRNISGNAGIMDDGGIHPGALYLEFYASNGYTATAGPWRGHMQLDSSRIVPIAPENRPVNTAVRYLVRALP